MKDSGYILLCVVLGSLAMGFAAGYGAGASKGESNVRREAVAAKAAHWVADQETGESKFVWGKP